MRPSLVNYGMRMAAILALAAAAEFPRGKHAGPHPPVDPDEPRVPLVDPEDPEAIRIRNELRERRKRNFARKVAP